MRYSIKHNNGKIIVNVENTKEVVQRLKELKIETKESKIKIFKFDTK